MRDYAKIRSVNNYKLQTPFVIEDGEECCYYCSFVGPYSNDIDDDRLRCSLTGKGVHCDAICDKYE